MAAATEELGVEKLAEGRCRPVEDELVALKADFAVDRALVDVGELPPSALDRYEHLLQSRPAS